MAKTKAETNKKKEKISLPSMLSFDRKLETSDGLMFAGNWKDFEAEDKWEPIPIVPRGNRSTQSAHNIKDEKKTMSNPVSSDSDDANLLMNNDTLRLSFSLRVIGNLGKPFACNAPNFATAIEKKVEKFKKSDGINKLAFRYAYNIASGRFLWRNRVGAEEIKIMVGFKGISKKLDFNAYDFSLKDFEKGKENEDLMALFQKIKDGLNGNEDTFTLIHVNAFSRLGNRQHVFPSQEMNIGEKKKKLFQLNGCAAMHNVKIGNAIRTIDTWYGDTMLVRTEGKSTSIKIEEGSRFPIAIEPYGSVTQHGRAYRPNKIDLYTLMLSWLNESESEEGEDNQCYVVANLIRGGVFSRGKIKK